MSTHETDPDVTTLALDRRLVAALCRDGRADVSDLARVTGIAPTELQRRLRALDERGAIGGFTARLDYGALGYDTVVFRLRVDLEAVDAVTDRLNRREPFTTVYQTSGPETVFALGRFDGEASIAACLYALHADPDIRTVRTEPVEAIHREADCPIPPRDPA